MQYSIYKKEKQIANLIFNFELQVYIAQFFI